MLNSGNALHRGLETERILEALVGVCELGELTRRRVAVAMALEEARPPPAIRNLQFEAAAAPTWEEAESCLAVLRRGAAEEELAT